MDKHQTRYAAHQERKRDVLMKIIEERHSERRFSGDVVGGGLEDVLRAADRAPSSCDRRGVEYRLVNDRDGKALLGGLLVGGVGWIHRAPLVVLFFANPDAYKAPREIEWNPYLDTGVMAGQMQLAAESVDLKTCFVNPNVRESNQEFFSNTFGPGLFTGALAIGKPHPEDVNPPLWVLETS